MTSALQENRRYGLSMVLIHWLMAVGILTAFGVGLYMVDIPGITPFKLKLFNWHKWLGVTLFALVALRVLIRVYSRAPRYPAHWGHRTILLAKLGHWALYALMFAVPTLGYLYSLASGYPVVWFGVIELPVLIDKDPVLKDAFKLAHELSAKGLVLLVLGHVVMALKHHVLDNDGVLGRMIPGMKAD
ncbi:MAG TPA: cytochrome b [Limnobacter sp.]|nr:cytochrome b [Limnobacter sp.]